MIVKNKILSNEIIKRKLGIIDSKDKYLFQNDLKKFLNRIYIILRIKPFMAMEKLEL